MSRLINKGNNRDLPIGFASDPEPKVAGPGQTLHRFRRGKRWVTVVRDSEIAEATLLLDADFENGIYMMGGESVAFEDIFSAKSAPLALIAGQGLVHEKLAGVAPPPTPNPHATFSAAARALMAVNGGFTAIVDSTMVDGPSSQSGGCHFSDGIVLAYHDAAFAEGYYQTELYRHDTEGHSPREFEYYAGVQGYDYDSTIGENQDSQLDPYNILGRTNAGMTMKQGSLTSYFEGNTPLTITPALSFPRPGFDTMKLYVYATVHSGTAENKLLVTCKTTLHRLRVYTPGQAPGWIPNES
jgi:hypothetical protein